MVFSGEMDGGKRVWAPHSIEGFILGTIADISETEITVQPVNSEKVQLLIPRKTETFLPNGNF